MTKFCNFSENFLAFPEGFHCICILIKQLVLDDKMRQINNISPTSVKLQMNMDIDHSVLAGFITYLNGRSVKVSGKFQAMCAILTISSLVLIIVSGCIHMAQGKFSALQWRHNGRDDVSKYQPHDCLLNSLFRRLSKKTSKLRVTGLCAGNSPVTGEFPATKVQ